MAGGSVWRSLIETARGVNIGTADLRERRLPDPADYYWPGRSSGRGGKIRCRQCRAPLRMSDGEQVRRVLLKIVAPRL